MTVDCAPIAAYQVSSWLKVSEPERPIEGLLVLCKTHHHVAYHLSASCPLCRLVSGLTDSTYPSS